MIWLFINPDNYWI